MAQRLSLILVDIDIFMDKFADGGTEEQLEQYLMVFVRSVAEVYPTPDHLRSDIVALLSGTAQALFMLNQQGD